MTKRLLLLISSCIASFQGFCQPVLSQSTNYQAGDVFKAYETDTFSVALTGPAVTWNYASLPLNVTDTEYYDPCSVSTACGSFPGTNVFYHATPGEMGTYFHTSSSALSVTGIDLGSPIPYSNYEDILRYPFTYNDNYIDTFSGIFTYSGSTYYRSGTITVTGDGYGTLMLPTGNFNNVLRVHKAELYTDSIVTGASSSIAHYVNNYYTWYTPGRREVLLDKTNLVTVGFTPNTYAFYTNQTPSGVPIIDNTGESVSVFPNPANEAVNITFNTLDNELTEVYLTDIAGRNLAVIGTNKGSNGLTKLSCNTSSLPAGLYFIQLKSDKGTVSRKMEVLH